MITLESALSAIAEFLNEAQNFGIIKAFSLEYSDVNENYSSEANQFLTKFVQRIQCESATTCDQNVVGLKDPVENEIESKSESNPDENFMQIKVDKNEVKRRISAYMSLKRKERDETNVQEFCNHPFVEEHNPLFEQMDSCARVDAVFVTRIGSKSRLKVSKVKNRWGPQTQLQPDLKKIKKEPNVEYENLANDSIHAIEERLQNMESYLKLASGNSLRSSIFQRLKNLEDRILYLESISPDYFHLSEENCPSPKKKKQSEKGKLYSHWSYDELQKRIQVLKKTLKEKSHINSEPPD